MRFTGSKDAHSFKKHVALQASNKKFNGLCANLKYVGRYLKNS